MLKAPPPLPLMPPLEEMERQYELCRRAVDIDPLEARRAGERARALALQLGDRRRAAQALCGIGLSCAHTDDYEEAFEYLDGSVAECMELGYDFGAMDALIAKGATEMLISRHTEALASFEKAREIAIKPGAERADKARAYIIGNIAIIHMVTGQYVEALETFYQLLDEARVSGDSITLINTLQSLTHFYGEMEEYEKAAEFCREALEIRRSEGLDRTVAVSLVDLAVLYIAMGRLDEAEEMNDEALEIAIRLDQTTTVATVKRNQADILRARGRIAEALEILDEALELLRDCAEIRTAAGILAMKGALLVREGRYREAIPCLLEARDVTREMQEPRREVDIEQGLATAYRNLGDYERAVEHGMRSLELTHKLLSRDRQKALASMEVGHRTEQAEKEREIYRLKSEKLEMENLSKTKELTAMTMNLVQKKKELEKLRAMVEQMTRAHEGDSSELARDLLAGIDTSLRSEGEWTLFEQQFDIHHPGFIRKLLERSPTLTPAELRVCSLLRINLATKEIASLLNVSSRAVEGHRYHLRKKLGLPPKMSLGAYLSSL